MLCSCRYDRLLLDRLGVEPTKHKTLSGSKQRTIHLATVRLTEEEETADSVDGTGHELFCARHR